MNRMISLGLLLGLASPCVAGSLVETDAARRKAQVMGSAEALGRILADDLTYTHSNGLVHTRSELVGAISAGILDYRSIDVEEVEAKESGDVGILTGRQFIEITVRGVPMSGSSRFTATYMRNEGHWQLSAYQSTPLPRPGEVTETATALMSAYNHHDIDALLATLSPDIEWIDVSNSNCSVAAAGHDAIGEYMSGYFKMVPTVRGYYEDQFQVGNMLAFRERVAWESSGGQKTQAVLGVMEIAEGKVRRVWYFPAHD